MRDILIKAYLDYVNNYLTIEKWAEHNGMTVEHAARFMRLALDVLNSKHPDA
jgi:hypothetical protein